MAFIQKNLPNPKPKLNFVLNKFNGGLNNTMGDSELEDNEASDLLNVVFTNDNVIEKRNGIKYYNDTIYDGNIVFIDEFITIGDGIKQVIGTENYLYIDGVQIAELSGKVSGTSYIGKYVFIDDDTIRVYGKFPTASDDHTEAIGTYNGDYTVLYVVNPTDGYVPLDDTFTIGKFIYNYTLGTVAYEPCQNELTDVYKGVNSIPSKPSCIVLHGDRLFTNGDVDNPGNVFISDIQNPYYFPVGLPIQLPPNGEHITGMYVFMDSVVVGRQKDVHAIYGNTNLQISGQFIMKRINTHTGFANNDSIAIAHNYLFYMGDDGVIYSMITTKTDVDMLTTRELSKKLDLFSYPINATQDDINNSKCVFHDNNLYMCVGSRILIYDYRQMNWTMFDGIPNKSIGVLNRRLVFGGNGRLYDFGTGYDDLGVPIVCYWASKRFNMDKASNYKQFKEMFVVAYVYNDFKSEVRVKYEIDYVDIRQIAQITNQISIWGRSIFGNRFITRNISPSLPINIGQRGRVIRFIVANGEPVATPVETLAELDSYPNPIDNMLVKVNETSYYYRYHLGTWTQIDNEDLFQPLKIYEINGEYQMRGKR